MYGLARVIWTKGLREVDESLTQTDVPNFSILYLIFWIVVENLQVLLWGKDRDRDGCIH